MSNLPGGQQTKNNVECGGIWALPKRREVNGIRGYLGEQTEPNQLCYSILRVWGKEEKEKRRKNDLEWEEWFLKTGKGARCANIEDRQVEITNEYCRHSTQKYQWIPVTCTINIYIHEWRKEGKNEEEGRDKGREEGRKSESNPSLSIHWPMCAPGQ